MSSLPETSSETFIDPELIGDLCQEVSFAPGDLLRVKGLHYIDMYLLTDGEVEIELEKKGRAKTLTLRRGSPIGEISFLTGLPATATVRTKGPARGLYIDDGVLAELERQRPEVAADLYRQLAQVAEGRQSHNLLFFSDGAPHPDEKPIEVRLCRSPAMLLDAQRIRYEVYCEELGRTSPFADPERRIIADDLDTFAQVLLALAGDEPVGTMRLNAAHDGPLGALEQIYGMVNSPFHPKQTGICTKFIIRKSHRYGQGSFRLMASSLDIGVRSGIKGCYIDCIPQLLPFYMSLGFRQSAPAFLHRENGRSIPLSLDVEKYAPRITRLTGFALK